MNETTAEKECWEKTTNLFGEHHVTINETWSEKFLTDPLAFTKLLTLYKFTKRLIRAKSHIFEFFCNGGIGATILAEHAQSYLGYDEDNLQHARASVGTEKIQFIEDKQAFDKTAQYDSIVSLSISENATMEYLPYLLSHLKPDGVVFISSPHLIQTDLENLFHRVLPFHLHQAVIQPGWGALPIAVCCHPR